MIAPRRGNGWVALVVAAAVACPACPGAAQTAPEGNAHPGAKALSEAPEAQNPFGDPIWPDRDAQAVSADAQRESKRRLAAEVDLSALRGLAVFHGGRVKIVDTLARETVREITGRKRYTEAFMPPGEEKFAPDPVFTWLDVMIDPAYYADRPLLGVGFLPLREKILEAAFPGDATTQRRWKMTTRVSPIMTQRYGPAVEERWRFERGYGRALNALLESFDLYIRGHQNLLLVPPEGADAETRPWRHVSTLPEDSPVRRAFLTLGAAWRAGDAAGINRSAAELGAALAELSDRVYPAQRRSLELAYNRAHAFHWGAAAYGTAFVALLLAFGTGRRWLAWAGTAALLAGVALHAGGFVARCVIAERFAIQNQFESMTGLSLFGAVVGVGIMAARRQWLYGAAAAGLGFLVLLVATESGIPGTSIEREAAILNTSVLLKYHVTTVLVSYALITLGFIIALFYLGVHYATRGARALAGAVSGGGAGGPEDAAAVAARALGLPDVPPGGPARTLHDLDRAQVTVLQLAFWTLGVGILLGAWWADHSWGRWWAFDPKETWALATWIIYLIVIHLRLATGPRRGLVTAWMSVAGFVVMIWTYFGVNLLLPGLHAYA